MGRAGATLTATALTMVFAQGILVGRLGWPPHRLLAAGAALALVAMLGLVFAPNYPVFLAAMATLGLGLGLLLPGNLAALSLATGVGAQGKVAGINAIGQGLGLVLGPILGTALYQKTPVAPALGGTILIAGICLLAAIIAARHTTARGKTA